MGRIIRLPADLCNQIAAGEVVERPASIAKELIENSIDAGCTRIAIDVEGGGMSLLRISDDGCGMDEQDAVLALERHATSKLKKIEDLGELGTFGFRGEALPSIASVSKFVLRTRIKDAPAGVEVQVDGGAPMIVRPCGVAPGTIIEVRDLFFNVPARRKFLKTQAAEAGAITAIVDALALCTPQLNLVLTRDGRKARQWLRTTSRKERVLESHPNDKLAEISGQRGPLALQAYLSPPELARSGAVGLSILVNNRVIRDRIIARLIAHAYGSVLESGRYPIGVVFIDINPALLDVNVHPQKAEVRFSDTKAVHDSIYRIVSDGLGRAFGLSQPSSHSHPPLQASPIQSRTTLSTVTPYGSLPTPAAVAPALTHSDGLNTLPSESAPDPWGLAPPAPEPTDMVQVALALAPTRSPAPQSQPSPAPAAAAAPAAPLSPIMDRSRAFRYADLRFCAQIRQIFLICEGPDGMYVLDQHAAAERVTFGRLHAAYHAKSIASQRLLSPVPFAIDDSDAAFIEEAAEAIAATGLEISVIGPQTASIASVPQILRKADPERLARDLLDELTRNGGRNFSGAIDLALATMACHASLRAGEKISNEQAISLIEALDQVDHAGHCPHGRPLVMRISYDELERQVGRK
jgi:DNA mismatch repair protein MutL